MNPLVHTRINVEFLTENNIRPNPLIVLGGVLPDLCLLGCIEPEQSHNSALQFMSYLKKTEPSFLPLSIGFMLHGESPAGVDAFAHNGFIESQQEAIFEILKKHKPLTKGIDINELIHIATEFSCDSLMQRRDAINIMSAFRQSSMKAVGYHIARFFNADPSAVLNALLFFRHFDFDRLRSIHRAAGCFQGFCSYQRDTGLELVRKYRFVISKLHFFRRMAAAKVLQEITEVVQDDLYAFIDKSKAGMRKTLLKHIPADF